MDCGDRLELRKLTVYDEMQQVVQCPPFSSVFMAPMAYAYAAAAAMNHEPELLFFLVEVRSGTRLPDKKSLPEATRYSIYLDIWVPETIRYPSLLPAGTRN